MFLVVSGAFPTQRGHLHVFPGMNPQVHFRLLQILLVIIIEQIVRSRPLVGPALIRPRLPLGDRVVAVLRGFAGTETNRQAFAERGSVRTFAARAAFRGLGCHCCFNNLLRGLGVKCCRAGLGS